MVACYSGLLHVFVLFPLSIPNAVRHQLRNRSEQTGARGDPNRLQHTFSAQQMWESRPPSLQYLKPAQPVAKIICFGRNQ